MSSVIQHLGRHAISIPDFVSAALVLALSAGYLAWSWRYPPALGAIPSLVAWVAIALSCVDVVAQTRTRAGAALRKAVDQPSEAALSRENPAGAGWKPEAAAIAWPLAYVAALIGFGFLPMTLGYVFLYMRWHGRRSFGSSAFASIIVTLTIWILFEVVFRYPLFRGIMLGAAVG